MDDASTFGDGGLSPSMMVLVGGGVIFAAYAFRKIAEDTGKKHAKEAVKETAEDYIDEAKEAFEEYMP